MEPKDYPQRFDIRGKVMRTDDPDLDVSAEREGAWTLIPDSYFTPPQHLSPFSGAYVVHDEDCDRLTASWKPGMGCHCKLMPGRFLARKEST